MSANLIGFGCDLQQKLDAMSPRDRRMRWAGDVGVSFYRIAQKLHRLSLLAVSGQATSAAKRREQQLMEQAQQHAAGMGRGIQVYRLPHPRGWPLYIVFPGDVPPGSEMEAYYEQGIAVPPRQ